MAYRKRRPPCQGCEGQKLRRLSGAWANEGSVPVSYYTCLDCGTTGITGEFWLPAEASLTGLDFDRRLTNRVLKRRSRGIVTRVHDRRKNRRLTSDTIVWSVRIIPGKVEAGLAKRLAGLRRKRAAA